MPDARLVHGLVVNSFTGKLTEHAWCEVPATATYEDGSTGPITVAIDYTQVDARARIIPAETLYEKTGVQQLQRFTFAEAIRHAAEAGHDGPWSCSPLVSENLSIGSAPSDETNSASVSSKSALDRSGEHG